MLPNDEITLTTKAWHVWVICGTLFGLKALDLVQAIVLHYLQYGMAGP